MIDRPDAHRLLLAVADALSDDIVPALSAAATPQEAAAARYTARIAANLCRILAREVELEPAARAATVADLRMLLGRPDGSLAELSVALDDALRSDADLDPLEVHRVLTAAVERRLAIARPSYRHPDGGSGL